MYEAFYGFKEKPFSMLPDPGFLYLSKKHQAALTLLEYGLLNHVGFCVISGEAGAGKTTILRALLERIEDNITVGLITNTHQSFGGLLDWVLSAFDLHRPNLTHVEMHQVFMEYLIEEYANGRTVLLIVDEAQNMKPDALEELRMLSNVNSAKDQLMQVVLAGQPALKETLRMPDLMQFAQRIAVDYHLDALNLKETCGYIQHRLTVAGAQKDVFTPAACERIHNYSGGTPRLINLLCETVLVYGFADQQEMIDVDLVDEMVLERMKDSVVPIVNRDIGKSSNAEASKELEKDFPWIRPEGSSEAVKPSNEAVSLKASPAKKPQAVKKPAVKKQIIKGSKNPAVVDDKKNVGKIKTKKTSAIADSVIFSHESQNAKNVSEGSNDTQKQLIKYGVIAAVVATVLIVSALMLDGGTTEPVDVAKDEVDDNFQRQQEQNEKQIRQLRIETETLKKERDAAVAKANEEQKAKQAVEKIAAEKSAIAAKAASDKRRLQEKQQIEAAKKRELSAKKSEAKAREETKRAKREAARLKEQKRVMQVRLDEERRLNKVEEARRFEFERQQSRLREQQAVQARAKKEAAEKAAAEAAKKSSECSGPTARFKSGCR